MDKPRSGDSGVDDDERHGSLLPPLRGCSFLFDPLTMGLRPWLHAVVATRLSDCGISWARVFVLFSVPLPNPSWLTWSLRYAAPILNSLLNLRLTLMMDSFPAPIMADPRPPSMGKVTETKANDNQAIKKAW